MVESNLPATILGLGVAYFVTDAIKHGIDSKYSTKVTTNNCTVEVVPTKDSYEQKYITSK